MKKHLTSSVVLSVLTLALPVFGQQGIGEPGYAIGPNTPALALTAPPPSYGTASNIKLDLSSIGFKPLGDGQWGTNGGTGMSHRNAGANNAQCTNVNLPSGALLSGITTYISDSDATGDVSYIFYNADMNASTLTPLFTYASAGTPGVEILFHLISPAIQINNDDSSYAICTFHGVVGAPNENGGVTFWYKLQVSPAPAVATFTDVPTDDPRFRFVEALYAAGITGGCGVGLYCPNNAVTRGQMAVFLSVALGLHFPN